MNRNDRKIDLDVLRCPLDPSQKLLLEGDRLVCVRCAAGFAIKDGFPQLVAEEAIPPKGVNSVADLPCYRGRVKSD